MIFNEVMIFENLGRGLTSGYHGKAVAWNVRNFENIFIIFFLSRINLDVKSCRKCHLPRIPEHL